MKKKKKVRVNKFAIPIFLLFLCIGLGLFIFTGSKCEYEDYGIPIVSVQLNGTTLDKINEGSKETKYKNNKVTVYEKGRKKFSSKVTIKGRGNNSWTLLKKPYQLSFDKEKSILGLPEAEKFVFLANYNDSSLMRNGFIYNISKNIGLNSKTGKYCDLYVDDKYIGNYYVIPKVTISPSSMDLKDENAVLIELDNKYYEEEEHHFTSSVFNDHLVLKDYKGKDYKLGFDSFQSRYNEMEKYIEEKDFEHLKEVMDVESFVDYYLLLEYSTNMDGLRSSFYMYMDGIDDKIHVGQIWDFDMGFGSIALTDQTTQMPVRNNTFTRYDMVSELLYKLTQIPEFDDLTKNMWNNDINYIFKEEINNIDKNYKILEKSGTENNKLWNANYYDRGVNFFKRWTTERYNYFNEFFK